MQRKIRRAMVRYEERQKYWERPHRQRRIKIRQMAVSAGTAAILTLFTVTPTLATPIGSIVFDPTNYAENLRAAIQSVIQVQNQYTQITQQLQQLANEAQNLADGMDYSSQIRSAYQNITNMKNYIRGLVTDYSIAMDEWDKNYPKFASYKGMSAGDFADQAQAMLQTSDNAIQASYQTNALVSSNAATHQDNLKLLLAASKTAPGAKAALQTLAQISGIQCQQMQDLITVARQSSNAQNAYYENVVQVEARKKAELEDEQMKDNSRPKKSGAAYPQ